MVVDREFKVTVCGHVDDSQSVLFAWGHSCLIFAPHNLPAGVPGVETVKERVGRRGRNRSHPVVGFEGRVMVPVVNWYWTEINVPIGTRGAVND
jgi:hypothetical protein